MHGRGTHLAVLFLFLSLFLSLAISFGEDRIDVQTNRRRRLVIFDGRIELICMGKEVPKTAQEWSPPEYILSTRIPLSPTTWVHTVTVLSYPTPSCPLALSPQLKTSPRWVRHREWLAPAATIFTGLLSIDCTSTGSYLLSV